VTRKKPPEEHKPAGRPRVWDDEHERKKQNRKDFNERNPGKQAEYQRKHYEKKRNEPKPD
jgi:hypothetical protein